MNEFPGNLLLEIHEGRSLLRFDSNKITYIHTSYIPTHASQKVRDMTIKLHAASINISLIQAVNVHSV